MCPSLRSYNDAVAPWSADAGDVSAALGHPELAGCEVSAGGQTAIMDATGGFLLRNIVARDDFGADGPGTPRDFLSDDLFRIIGTCGAGDSRTWIFSDYYQVAANRTVIVPHFTVSATPPPEPDRLTLTLVIAPPTAIAPIIVAGRLGALSGSSLPVPPHPGLVTDVGDVVLGRRDSLGTDFLVLFEPNLPNPVLTLFVSGPVATSHDPVQGSSSMESAGSHQSATLSGTASNGSIRASVSSL